MTTLRAGSATDVGRVRQANQDAKLVAPALVAVADGMGGHQGGEVAAAIAIDTLAERTTTPRAHVLLRAAYAANRTILARAAADPDLAGMGTTLVALGIVRVSPIDTDPFRLQGRRRPEPEPDLPPVDLDEELPTAELDDQDAPPSDEADDDQRGDRPLPQDAEGSEAGDAEAEAEEAREGEEGEEGDEAVDREGDDDGDGPETEPVPEVDVDEDDDLEDDELDDDLEAEEELAWVSVGDSRIYLFRDDELVQLTTDHSLVEDLRRDGRLSAEEAAVHPQRNILTRALGIDPNVEIDCGSVLPFVGDRYVLCSDGLFNEVSSDQIAATLRRLDDPDDVAAELVRLANDHGGRDNITCVVADVTDDGGRAQAAALALAAEQSRLASRAPESASDVAAESDDLAGFASPLDDLDDIDDIYQRAGVDTPHDHLDDLDQVRVRRFTWRVVAFVVALLLIAAGTIAAIGYVNQNTYYVGFKDEKVTLFQGHKDPWLWFGPHVVDMTSITRDQVPKGSFLIDINNGTEFSSKAAAVRYLENLRTQISQDNAKAAAATTTTTSSTTVTSPPVTGPILTGPGATAPTPLGPTTTPTTAATTTTAHL